MLAPLLLLSVIPLSLSNPLDDGDILLSPDEKAMLFKSHRGKRQAWMDRKWPTSRIPYELTDLSDRMKFQIRKAMQFITAKTCIKFEKSLNEIPRAVFLDDGCYSKVGVAFGNATRVTSLSTGCPLMGHAFHEISHLLGFWHHQSRPDRDDYLYVNSTDETNFGKFDFTFNLCPFEYGSVMMYSARDVMMPKDLRFLRTMGNRLVTFYDVLAINRFYQCSCDKELECKNGGYTNPANCSECNCPAGFGGVLCDRAPTEFSKVLQAESEWKVHNFKFGYLGLWEVHEFIRATLFIKAPEDKTIQVEPTKMAGFFCSNYCANNGFEVKHMGDPRMTNVLFCCKNYNDWNVIFTSKLNPTPINFFTRKDRIELEFRYRWINGSVDDLPKTTNGYDDYLYPK